MTGELKGGYAGKILRINLTDQTFSEEPLPVEMARDFIGGAVSVLRPFSTRFPLTPILSERRIS